MLLWYEYSVHTPYAVRSFTSAATGRPERPWNDAASSNEHRVGDNIGPRGTPAARWNGGPRALVVLLESGRVRR